MRLSANSKSSLMDWEYNRFAKLWRVGFTADVEIKRAVRSVANWAKLSFRYGNNQTGMNSLK